MALAENMIDCSGPIKYMIRPVEKPQSPGPFRSEAEPPFWKDRFMEWKKRCYCGELTPSQAGTDVLLMGWVDAIRDHGNLLFIHLRDGSCIVQAVFDPGFSAESYERAGTLKEEYVIEMRGKVATREKGTENPNLETGNIEIFAKELVVLSGSRMLPFKISEKAMVFGEDIQANPENVDEELRLTKKSRTEGRRRSRYRY